MLTKELLPRTAVHAIRLPLESYERLLRQLKPVAAAPPPQRLHLKTAPTLRQPVKTIYNVDVGRENIETAVHDSLIAIRSAKRNRPRP